MIDWLTRELGTNWLTNKVTARRTSFLEKLSVASVGQFALIFVVTESKPALLRYCVHGILILNKFSEIHITTICFFKTKIIVIHPSRRLFISGFQNKIWRYIFLYTLWMIHAHTTVFVLNPLIIFSGNYTLWSCLLRSFLRHRTFSFHSDLEVLLSTVLRYPYSVDDVTSSFILIKQKVKLSIILYSLIIWI